MLSREMPASTVSRSVSVTSVVDMSFVSLPHANNSNALAITATERIGVFLVMLIRFGTIDTVLMQ